METTVPVRLQPLNEELTLRQLIQVLNKQRVLDLANYLAPPVLVVDIERWCNGTLRREECF